MSRKLNVLVMAVGSPLGQSIYKALARSRLSLNIYLADISRMAAGFYMGDPAGRIVLPLVKDDAYFAELKQAVRKYLIQVIFPVISVEYDFFERHSGYFESRGIKVIIPKSGLYALCNDKYRSMVHLGNSGIRAPDSALWADKKALALFLERNRFPVILKPRFGASGADVFLVKDRNRLSGIADAFPGDYFVVQEYLSARDEYTVGVFISKDGAFKRTFVIRRELKFGLSYRGEAIVNEAISDYCLKVCSVFGFYYAANVQLKMVNGDPCVFEINPRLSSTTAVRAHFGFNEPEMILWDLFFDMSKYPFRTGTGKFMRYWEEAYRDES